MSAIHRLLCCGVSLALFLGAAGCAAVTARHVSFDSMRDDRSPVNAMLAEGGLQYGTADSDPGRIRSVLSVTPKNRQKIRELRELNPYSVGWLSIPGTAIDDVVLKNPKSLNNDFFLNHDFYGYPDRNGEYCADYRSELYGGRGDLSRITAVYGHSWDDDPEGELFSQLKKFRDEDFARRNPYIFFSTGKEDMAWEIFAVFDTTVYLPYIHPKLSSDLFYDMIGMINGLTLYNYDSVVNYDDKILALSTCTYSVEGHPSLPAYNDYRFVVMAKLAEPSDPLKKEAVFAANSDPLGPDATLIFKA